MGAEIRGHFGLRDPIVVLVETDHPDGIYNLDTLTRVQRLSEALASLEGVGSHDVTSLATERRDRVYTGTLEFRPYLDPLPDSPELMATLRSDVEAAEILTGTLISADARAVSILVKVPQGQRGDSSRRIDFYTQVLEATRLFETETDRILVVGAPVAEALLGLHIFEDLSLLLPLALAVIALAVLIGCRRLWGVALAFIEVGACLVATFGLMGWLGFPVYLTTAVLPVILTSVGLADEIHIFWHYQRILARDDGIPAAPAVVATMKDMSRPLVLSSLTTSLAFLSFLASPIAAVASFGLFAAFGTLFCMVWSLTVIPACLALIPAEKMRRPPSRSDRLPWLVAPLSTPRRTLAVLGVLSLILALGISRLDVQDSWVAAFAEDSDFRQATARANDLLYGTHLLLAHLSFGSIESLESSSPSGSSAKAPLQEPLKKPPKKPLYSPPILEAIGELEDFVRGRPEVGGVLGTYSHLTTVAYLWQGRREGSRRIPQDPGRVEKVIDRFDQGRGEHRRREVIDDAGQRTIVTIFLEEANYRDTAVLMTAIRVWVDEHLAPHGARLDFAGDVAVSQAMIPAIVRTQVSSLLLAMAGALTVLCLIYRSFLTGLLVMLPTCFAVLWVFGLMGWLGIPLGVATSMFCAITLGIGVDYGIHLVERLRRHREAGQEEPVLRAVEEAGPAITADALAISLGFGLLVVSQVPANARLGALVAVALLAAAVLTLAGLASLLTVFTRSLLN